MARCMVYSHDSQSIHSNSQSGAVTTGIVYSHGSQRSVAMCIDYSQEQSVMGCVAT